MARSKEGSVKGQDRVKQDSLEAARPSSAPRSELDEETSNKQDKNE